MSGKCKQCGCTEAEACYHPEFGPCWWMNDDEDLCSHCVELADDPAVERPNDQVRFMTLEEMKTQTKPL